MSTIRNAGSYLSQDSLVQSPGRLPRTLRWMVQIVIAAGLLLAANAPAIRAFDGGSNGGGTSNGPVITDFAAIAEGDNVWSFEGTVSDPNPGSCTVYFGGLPSLQGKSCSVQADGNFIFCIVLTPADDGTATAQAVDGQGLKSAVEIANVDNP